MKTIYTSVVALVMAINSYCLPSTTLDHVVHITRTTITEGYLEVLDNGRVCLRITYSEDLSRAWDELKGEIPASIISSYTKGKEGWYDDNNHYVIFLDNVVWADDKYNKDYRLPDINFDSNYVEEFRFLLGKIYSSTLTGEELGNAVFNISDYSHNNIYAYAAGHYYAQYGNWYKIDSARIESTRKEGQTYFGYPVYEHTVSYNLIKVEEEEAINTVTEYHTNQIAMHEDEIRQLEENPSYKQYTPGSSGFIKAVDSHKEKIEELKREINRINDILNQLR